MLPKGIASSGFPRVRETCKQIGIVFDPWQTDLNRCMLAKTPDGLYAADTVVMSIPRQVGKTFDVGAVVFAECIAEPGTTVIWTAHRFKVARETFNELRGLAKSPKLAPHIDYDAITTAAGNECIPFENGSRIVFAARERGAIRGFTKVRILILDEAQILTQSVLADLAPTMNQASNPLIVLMGTPPKPGDPAEVFTNLRTTALEQYREHGYSEDGVMYVEFSAEPGSVADDRAAWRQANPSYPDRTPARAILRMRKLLADDDFLREALGIWDSDGSRSPIKADLWARAESESSAAAEVYAFAVAVDPDRAWSAVGAAGPHCTCEVPFEACEPGLTHVEVIDHNRGTGWVVARCVELGAKYRAPFIVDGGGPAASLIADLEAAGLTVLVANMRDVARSFGLFIDALSESSLRHGPQEELTAAAKSAKTRPCGDGGQAFGRKASGADITPLEVVSLAHWAAVTRGPVHVLSTIW